MSRGGFHNSTSIKHLYLHIPFCARICPYCAFYKERTDSKYSQRFCEALLLELDKRQTDCPLELETIFLGGGTPTALTIAQLRYLLGGLRERLDLSALTRMDGGSESGKRFSKESRPASKPGCRSDQPRCSIVGQ